MPRLLHATARAVSLGGVLMCFRSCVRSRRLWSWEPRSGQQISRTGIHCRVKLRRSSGMSSSMRSHRSPRPGSETTRPIGRRGPYSVTVLQLILFRRRRIARPSMPFKDVVELQIKQRPNRRVLIGRISPQQPVGANCQSQQNKFAHFFCSHRDAAIDPKGKRLRDCGVPAFAARQSV